MLCLASIGLPGLNNFVSEMLDAREGSTTRATRASITSGLAIVAAIGILLSAWYMLTMMRASSSIP